MKDLPVGWIWTALGEAAEVSLRFDRSEIDPATPVSFVPMAAVEAGTGVLDPSATRTWASVSKGYVPFAEGDILFARITPCMENGKVAIARGLTNGIGAGSTEFHVIRARESIEPVFLLHYFLQERIRRDARAVMQGAAGQLRVPARFLQGLPLPLPPSAEQRRIVAEIEKQFTRLDHGVSALEAVSERVRVYFQSTLNSFTRPTKQKCKGWTRRSLSELAHIGTGSTPLRSNEEFWRCGTIPWVTSTAVNRPYIDEPQDLVTKVALERTTLKTYPPGTLLIAMYGEGKTRGKVSELRIDATINQALAAIQIRPEWSEYREYTKLALTCAYDQIRRHASGGVQPNLNLGMISALEVWLPPPSEVARITSDLSEQLTDAANMLSGVALALARAARLRQSILHKAFEGKLVPQDPKDEPASVILERIRAARG